MHWMTYLENSVVENWLYPTICLVVFYGISTIWWKCTHVPQNSRAEPSLSEGLVSYSGYLLKEVESLSSVDIPLVYSTAPTDLFIYSHVILLPACVLVSAEIISGNITFRLPLSVYECVLGVSNLIELFLPTIFHWPCVPLSRFKVFLQFSLKYKITDFPREENIQLIIAVSSKNIIMTVITLLNIQCFV